MKSFRKSVKAVSPVLSVLMMIAVAVAASLVTYAWVMGYLNFTTAKVGKAIQIQSIAYNETSSPYNLLIYVQNVGQGPVKLIDIYVNGIKQPEGSLTIKIAYPNSDTVLLEGKTATCMVTGYFDGSTHKLTDTLTIRAVTDDGTFTEATITLG